MAEAREWWWMADGFLVPAAARTLAEKIAYLLDNPDDARRMGEAAKQGSGATSRVAAWWRRP